MAKRRPNDPPSDNKASSGLMKSADDDEDPPCPPRSAGPSPASSRRFRFLTCVEPSNSGYGISELDTELATMSPRSRRSRIHKILSTVTSRKRSKVFSSVDEPPSPKDLARDVHEPMIRGLIKRLSEKDEREENAVTGELNYVTILVRVRLKEGQNLAIRDASGSSDPYVKFKYKDRVVYKSNIVYKNLNPIWDEEFQMLADDMTTPIQMEVYDYDRFCSDDYMGGACLDISRHKWFTPHDIVVELKDESTEEELGTVILNLTILPQTLAEKEAFLQKATRGVISEGQKKREKLIQMWTSVVNIVLVEGKGLSVNYNMSSPPDPYCKFKIGLEKYKSKVCTKTCDPKWIEQFDLHLYENGPEVLEVLCHDKRTNQVIGKATIGLSLLPRDQTVQNWYQLDDCSGSVLLLITVSGSQSTDSVVDLTEFDQNDIRSKALQKYDFLHTFDDIKDIGILTVKLFRGEDLQAKDIGGKSDPFAVLELVNTRLQTHTEYRTLCPQWNKLFTFGVKDIHTALEITVYDEDPNNKFEFLGKVAIPLLTIRNGERRWYALKDRKLVHRAKGHILVELDVVWNPIRATIRTFNPRERKFVQPEQKFKASLFRATVLELKEFAMEVVAVKDYVQSCFDWYSTPRSVTAFIIYMLLVTYVELYHLPIFILLLFMKSFFIRRFHDRDNFQREGSIESVGDFEEEKTGKAPSTPEKNPAGSSSLRETLSSVQETLAVVQNTLLFVNALLQRIKNTFNFTRPWLSWLAILVLVVATLLLYFVPIRVILVVWGINKFTKKLRNPHLIDNNEILDYLSRVPSDQELRIWRELRVERPR